jgi:predicted Zn-dependent peptidase
MRVISLILLFSLVWISCASHDPIQGYGDTSEFRLPAGPYAKLAWVPEGKSEVFVSSRPEEVILSNGIRVLLLADASRPLIQLEVRLATGNRDDPRGRTGVARLTADLLRSGGSETWPGDLLDEELAFRGASLWAESSFEETSVMAACLKEDFEDVFAMLADVLMNPSFPTAKVELALSQAKSLVRQRNDDPRQAATREARRAFYGLNDPRSRRMELQELADLDRNALVQFHGEQYGSRAAMVAVLGDFDRDVMLGQLEEVFANWPVQSAGVSEHVLETPSSESRRVYLAARDDVNQTEIRFFLEGIRRDHPDFPALRLASVLLGSGGFTNRMMKEVRTERGLAYWAVAQWSPEWDHDGIFVAASATKSETTATTIQAMLDVMEDFLETGVGQKEFKEGLNRMTRAEVFKVDTPGEILDQASDLRFHNYPWNFHTQLANATLQLTPALVLAAARRHLDPSRLLLFVMGNPADFESPLEQFGEVNLWVNEPVQNTALTSAKPLEVEQGKMWARRLLASHGGAQAWENTGALSWAFQNETDSGTSLLWFPDRFRKVIGAGEAAMEHVVSAEQAWLHFGQVTEYLQGEALEDASLELRFLLPAVLLRLARDGFVVTSPADKRLVLTHSDGAVLHLELNEHGLIQQMDSPLGSFRYGNFGLFDGLQLPMTRQAATGQGGLTHFSGWQQNPDVDPTWFEPPSGG